MSALTLGAKTATDIGAGESGTDTISNFENVNTGNGNDIVYGNALGNTIVTGFGADHLFGLGGNDVLDGGASNDDLFGGIGNDTLLGGGGADNLTGGAGKDVLFGGTGSGGDGAPDTFIFTSLSDSTQTHSGRDVIMDFEDGPDKIDLSAFDLTTFAGVDAVFTAAPGEWRVVTIGKGWLVQVDVNNDNKVDFAVEVRDTPHSINWDSGDFVI